MSLHGTTVDTAEVPQEEVHAHSHKVRETMAGYIEALTNERITDHSSNLFEAGVLTSLDVLSLVAFIEETFMLEISGDDIDMDTFGTIDGLVGMVTAMQGRHRSP
jgi:methoxymalonate biosynthesis acyl carrier protein